MRQIQTQPCHGILTTVNSMLYLSEADEVQPLAIDLVLTLYLDPCWNTTRFDIRSRVQSLALEKSSYLYVFIEMMASVCTLKLDWNSWPLLLALMVKEIYY